ncbi:MAG: beta-propeller fold lactonase family protein [Chitinophagaceae bacterium]
MRKVINILSITIIAMAGSFLISCNKLNEIFNPKDHMDNMGFVYTMGNGADKNTVLVYKQDANGKLSFGTVYNSGGKGLGKGLGSQGALILDKASMMLYAVNAGDNTISSFKVASNGTLQLHQTIGSGGTMPISLSVYKSWLYVVNGGGNICGFKVSGMGDLSMIPGSMQKLSNGDAGPAEILFQPDGSHLVVTEKNTNKICTFKVNSMGVAEAPVVNPAYAETPFGFVIAGVNQLIITNAFGGAAGKSVISSLSVGDNGVTGLTSSVPNMQTSVCWITLTKDEDYAYVTNTSSNTISSLHIGAKNRLELVDATAAKTGTAPIDIIVSSDAKFIFNVNSMSRSISGYKIMPTGGLKNVSEVMDLPASAAGLAVY